jgi:hypothetical protein
LIKCSFGLLQYSFTHSKQGDIATLKNKRDNPGDIYLQPFNQNLCPTKLKRLDHDTPEQYLGVFINMRGTWEKEHDERKTRHIELAETIKSSSITRHQAYMIHSIQYRPAISYILHHTRFTTAQCKELDSPIVNSLLPKMGFNRNTPRKVVFGPRKYGGLAFTHIETEQLKLQLCYYVKALRKGGLQSEEYRTLTAAYQQFLGVGTQFFSLNPEKFKFRPKNSKITFLWEGLWNNGMRIEGTSLWTPTMRIKGDEAIMDIIMRRQQEFKGTLSSLSDRMVRNANTVRLYIRCTLISDLANEGENIADEYYNVDGRRNTTEAYPEQPRPSTVAIMDWKRSIRLVACLSGAHHLNFDFTPIEDQAENNSPTFLDYFDSCSPAIQHLVGECPTDEGMNNIRVALENGTPMTIFGDGSVKEGKGAHATRVYASDEYLEDSPFVDSEAVTSGDPVSITSLRSETSSALSGLYLIWLASDYYEVPAVAPLRFIYDNKECLRRLDTLPDFEMVADPMATDYDIWAEMSRLYQKLQVEIKTTHVKGHQDDGTDEADLSREAQINIIMDAKASAMRESHQPTPPMPVFQSNRASLFIGNSLVADGMAKRIHNHLRGGPLQDYMMEKHGWDSTTFHSIDWIPLESYLKGVPTSKLTNIVKLIHGWQFSTTRKAMIDQDKDEETCDGLCPLGCTHKDHVYHYLQCMRQPGARQIGKELRPLERTMEKLNTHPDLARIILRSMKRYLTGMTPTLQWTTTDHHQELIRDAFFEQSKIGWKHLFLGHLGQRWRQAQQNWYDDLREHDVKVPKGQNGLTWAKTMLKGTMHLALNRWQIRNEKFHEDQKNKDYEKEREILIKEIDARYEIEYPGHPAVERLMGVCQDELTTGPNGNMRTWLSSLELVMKYLRPSLITTYLT